MAEDNKDNTTNKVFMEIAEELRKSNESNNAIEKNVKETSEIAQREEQTSFQDEQRFDLQVSLMKNQNTLLTNILENLDSVSFDKKEDKSKGKGLLSGLFNFSLLKKFIPTSFVSLFKPIFKAIFSKKGLLGLGKKLVKFIGAPIIAILAGIDFFKGWKEAKGSIAEKIQGAMSSVLSGLTMGLLKSETINEGFHKVNDFIFKNITVPVMDFIMNFPERITEMFGDVFNMDNLNTLMNIPLIEDIIVKIKEAFDFMKIRISENIIDPIQNFITYAIESFNEVLSKIQGFASRVKEIALAPIDAAKNFFKDTKDKYNEFKDKFSFKNLFESDQEKQQRKDIESKTVKTLNTTNETKNNTSNNNIITSNNKTVINFSCNIIIFFQHCQHIFIGR